MKVISHRGYWLDQSEKNTRAAFDRTLRSGFGTETDVRDSLGRLVVSHDPPAGDEMPWSELVAAFSGTDLPLAVNVKSDGLGPLLARAFAGSDVDWFAFDMSAPEMVRYARAGLPFYTRHSDVEPEPVLYGAAQGVWLDAFEQVWYDRDVVRRHLDNGKAVCVVSCELHGRDPGELWGMLAPLSGHPGLTLCTDVPDKALEDFAS